MYEYAFNIITNASRDEYANIERANLIRAYCEKLKTAFCWFEHFYSELKNGFVIGLISFLAIFTVGITLLCHELLF